MTLDASRWMEIAMDEVGVHETAGPDFTPRIIEYHSTTGLGAASDEVPWCSAFVNWVMEQAGIGGTGSAAARSWLHWGVSMDAPVFGCIVVLARGSNPAQGHVGFFCDEDGFGGIRLLGGNQNDEVKVARYDKSKVLGYRWPKEDQ